MDKEKVIAVCRPHAAMFIFTYVMAGVFILCGIILSAISAAIKDGFYLFIALFLIVAGIIFVIIPTVQKKTTYIELTDKRIIGHRGFLSTNKLTTPLSRVQDVQVITTVFGRIFGYNTILISSASRSGVEYKFPWMANAEEFAEAIQKAIEQEQTQTRR